MRLCVFCGSSPGNGDQFLAAARGLGRALAERGIGLVYGGASVGCMGALADAVLQSGGEVVGVIPRVLVEREIAHPGLSDLRIVQTLHERKALMAELSDGFIALPGGAGTLDELFEAWTWGQLGLHRKPVGLLNVAGYYDRLAAFLDHALAAGFLNAEHRGMLAIESEPDALLTRFAGYQPPARSKWTASLKPLAPEAPPGPAS
jgi:uncharacterized protein (TIGR00730 family)